MKKCPYCGAQMNDDCLFCTECGKPIPQGSFCPHCGASMNVGAAFCQNCGKIFGRQIGSPNMVGQNAYRQQYQKPSSSLCTKILILVLIGIVALAAIGSEGWWLWKNKINHSQSVEVFCVDTVAVDDSDFENMSSNEGYESILSERRLSYSDLEGKTMKELEIMRNSIYARHGYRFKREELSNYFSKFSWYIPITSDMTSVYNEMSDIEKYNVDFIKKHE